MFRYITLTLMPVRGFYGIIGVRVKERIITVPGQAIGQGSGPRPWLVTCGGAPNKLSRPPQKS